MSFTVCGRGGEELRLSVVIMIGWRYGGGGVTIPSGEEGLRQLSGLRGE